MLLGYAVCGMGAGQAMDEIFSSPKVQMMRITDKYLTDAPMAPTALILREMPQVVGAVCCFADFLCADGTSAEAAEKLRADAAHAAADAKHRAAVARAFRQRQVEERAALRAMGAVIPRDTGSDLEDDLEEEEGEAAAMGAAAAVEGEEEGAGEMLSCVSLAKVVDMYVLSRPNAPEAQALSALLKFEGVDEDERGRNAEVPLDNSVHMSQVRPCRLIFFLRLSARFHWCLWGCCIKIASRAACTDRHPAAMLA